jgi:transcriptional regulator GlxA family with amidase domain
MRTKARSVAVVVFDEVDLLDLASVAAVLSTAGRRWNWRPFKLFVGSTAEMTVASRDQLRVEAHGPLDACPTPDVVIVPGGYGARRLLDRKDVLAWLARAAPSAELMAAVGYGTLLLAKAGLLAEQRIAIPADVADLARELAPTAELSTAEPWLESNEFLTASTSAAAVDVALQIVSRLLGEKHAAAVATQLGHVIVPTRIEGIRLGLGKKPPL